LQADTKSIAQTYTAAQGRLIKARQNRTARGHKIERKGT